MRMCFAISALVIMVGLMSSTAAFAQSADPQVLCAAVIPCDAEGNVLAPYNKGSCAPHYQALCQQDFSNKISGQLAVCQTNTSALSVELGNLKKKVLRMKQKLARANARRAAR